MDALEKTLQEAEAILKWLHANSEKIVSATPVMKHPPMPSSVPGAKKREETYESILDTDSPNRNSASSFHPSADNRLWGAARRYVLHATDTTDQST